MTRRGLLQIPFDAFSLVRVVWRYFDREVDVITGSYAIICLNLLPE